MYERSCGFKRKSGCDISLDYQGSQGNGKKFPLCVGVHKEGTLSEYGHRGGGESEVYDVSESVVYNMDCMEYMRTLPDKAFSLAIVDPPYRNENQPTKDMRNNRFVKGNWLGEKPTKEYFDELKRVSERQIIWGANNFPEASPFKGFVVWRKLTIGEDFTMSACEIASLSENLGTTSKYFEYAPRGTKEDPRIHPTQKPVALYRWLLKHYARERESA